MYYHPVPKQSIMSINFFDNLGRNQHQPTEQSGTIVLSDKVQFDKVLQKRLPPDPDSIATSKSRDVDD
jgi:hypothetical protein